MAIGTYAKLILSDKSKQQISEFLKVLNIENPTLEQELHATLIQSRDTNVNLGDVDINFPITADGSEFQIFKTAVDDNCLVLLLDSPQLHSIHHYIRDNYNLNHDYPAYHPHITLSYDYSQPPPPNEFASYLQKLTFINVSIDPIIYGLHY